MFGIAYHWKLYLWLFLGLVVPLTVLMVGAWLPTQSLPFAFLALLFFVRIMLMKDKDYLDQARKIARESLRRQYSREPKQGESEILAQQIVNSRQVVFYVVGVFILAHLVLV